MNALLYIANKRKEYFYENLKKNYMKPVQDFTEK